MTTIVWFRRDLRVHDHTALYKAWEAGEEILPLFILDDRLLHDTAIGDKRLHAFLSAVRSLEGNLAYLGSKLLVRRGEPLSTLRELITELRERDIHVDKLVFNRDYTPFARTRDQAVAATMTELGVHTTSFKDVVLHEYHEVMNKQGKPYAVFTPYKRAWLTLPKEHPYPLLQELKSVPHLAELASAPIPTLEELGRTTPQGEEWAASHFGEKAARQRLQAFMQERIFSYKQARDIPAIEGTSRLSFALKAGTLSPRTVFHHARAALEQASEPLIESVETYISELVWREFYMQVLYYHPHTLEKSYLPEFDELVWENDDALFAKWCQGETGYPIVDAAMKQLNECGWMHNRLRMITASFLTKDLLIDWRKGMNYFAYQLIDCDDAANAGGWQWSASTGTDAQPYFRIFNPISQGEKFDPQGEFVKRYLPALSRVPTTYIHKPWEMPASMQREMGCIVGVDYPTPCVDHATQRKRALALYQEAKNRDKLPNK